MKYEIRQIDAYMYDGEWVENTSYLLGKYTTHAQDEGRSFLNFLRRKGIRCKRGCCRVVWDGDVYTLEERKTQMPLFVAIPIS